ncbi:hypothetical protein [Kistimonas asteriae]|uniref:hypothetical protein n=1 Tax=Kistimonas asteriae TaxID=517724 RepID=UPI001BA49656|nr:hypothetical protein [Kistimonas asteriae]
MNDYVLGAQSFVCDSCRNTKNEMSYKISCGHKFDRACFVGLKRVCTAFNCCRRLNEDDMNNVEEQLPNMLRERRVMAWEAVEDMLLRPEILGVAVFHSALCALSYQYVDEHFAGLLGYVVLCQWSGFLAGVALERGQCSEVARNTVLLAGFACLVQLSLIGVQTVDPDVPLVVVLLASSLLTFYSFCGSAIKGMEQVARDNRANND